MKRQNIISCKLLALVLAVLLALPGAAFAAESAALSLTTDTEFLREGSSFTLNAGFEQSMETNALTLSYEFNGDLFEYAAYAPADGSVVMATSLEDGVARITLMAPEWQLQGLGALSLQVKEGVELPQGQQQVSLSVEYVTRDGAQEKDVGEVEIAVFVTTLSGRQGPLVEGDTNEDYIVDMIDLSNIIDWYGFDSTVEDWGDWYVYFDFNESGDIDIYDIAYVARLLNTDGRAGLIKLIEKAEALQAQDYTAATWDALQQVLVEAKAVAQDMNATPQEIADAIRSLKAAIDNLEPTEVIPGVDITFDVTPPEAIVVVKDGNNNEMLPTEDNRLVYRLEPGNYTYWVSADGYHTQTSSFVVAAAETITVVLEEVIVTHIISFNVTPAEAVVEVSGSNGSVVAPTADNRLVYHLEAGVYTYTVSADGYVSQSAEFAVAGDATYTVALELAVDKSALSALVQEVEALDPEDYSEASWDVLDDALVNAIAVLNDIDATQAEVDLAYDLLLSAQNALVQIIKVESLTIHGNMMMSRNKTMQLTVTINPSNATYQDITWTSLTPSVVTVDSNGLVTAKNTMGFGIIQAEAHNGVFASFLIQVM